MIGTENAWQYMVSLHRAIPDGLFFSRERPGQKASSSEIRRWLNQRAIFINGGTPQASDNISIPVTQLVLFYKSDRSRTTMI